MSIQNWAMLLLCFGGIALFGGDASSLGGHATWAGGIVFAGGVVLAAIGTWEKVADREQVRRDKEQVTALLERLARLREQGALSEDEFASQKGELLGGEWDEASCMAGTREADTK